ncbi:MAG TPA: ABC transporter permease [Vicinamibacterales bacterium]|nr:ABC transporter permease [Vicinamibacterales bacterium]
MRDFKIAVRQLLRTPAFTVIVVVTLAVGIGANTAVFSLVNDVLLRELPVKSPSDLVLFRNVDGLGGRLSRAGENNGSIDPVTGRNSSTSFSLLTFERFRDHHPFLSDVFAYAPLNQINVLIDGQAETIPLGQLVSGDYFSGLGVHAVLGRTLALDDDQPSAMPVAVISHRYWLKRFGGDSHVIGQTIRVNRVPVTLIGVTPEGFAGAMQIGESADISLPLAQHARFQPERAENRVQPWYWWLRIMGRVAPNATRAQARASLEPTFQEAAREGWIEGRVLDFAVGSDRPAPPTLAADSGAQGEDDRRRQYAQSLHILMALVGLVLAAACANVANLLLARGATRRRDIAMRLALGATRAHVVTALVAESLLLASLGAGLGVLFAYSSRRLLLALRQFGGAPAVLDLPLDRMVLGFTLAAAAGTALLCGLAPALRATRIDLTTEFQMGTRLSGAGSRSWLTRTLMVVQIALALALLVSTGLFATTLRNLQQVNPGFNLTNLVLFQIDASSAGYAADDFVPMHARLQARLEQIPGVRAVTFSRVALLTGGRATRRISAPGDRPRPSGPMAVNINGVAANFFSAMEAPLVAGRSFDEHDQGLSPRVAIVNQTLAKTVFGNENPLGRRLDFSATPTAPATQMVIVGVAADMKYTALREVGSPTLYLPAPQMVEGTANYYVRSAVNSPVVATAIREAVRQVDPTLPVIDLRTEQEQIDRLTSQEHLFAWLSGFFGVVTTTLACVGLYGLMSYLVRVRTGEIGLRIALGAVPSRVLRMVLGESFAIAALGVVIGIGMALTAGRFIGSVLFGLSPVDLWIYGSSATIVLAVSLIASFLPAFRASQVDPMTALRAE